MASPGAALALFLAARERRLTYGWKLRGAGAGGGAAATPQELDATAAAAAVAAAEQREANGETICETGEREGAAAGTPCSVGGLATSGAHEHTE